MSCIGIRTILLLTTALHAIRALPSPSPSNISNLLNCNFEGETLCQWTQRSRYDWIVQTGTGTRKFRSAPYIPRLDHTLETDTGHFIAVTKGSYGFPQNDAKLSSPKFPLSASGICFRFWYYMYGEKVSRMSVHLHSKTLTQTLWSRSGTQGPRWKYAQLHFKAGRDENYLMVEDIEIYIKLSSNDDMQNPALDDIAANVGVCPPSNVCDFEDEYMCHFTQSQTDDFDWTFGTYGTRRTKSTGPKADHTLNSRYGGYAYIETSSPRVENQTAVLETRAFSAAHDSCLTFWYNMNGKTMGALNVRMDILTGGLQESKLVWSKSGNQGKRWHMAYVTIATSQPFMLSFEGIVGSGIFSDIAIDDFSVRPGLCPAFGTCDFEGDQCSWGNIDDGDNLDWEKMSGHAKIAFDRPRVDHTWNTEFGVYMYLEGVESWRHEMAKYMSPVLDKDTFYCLTLWYIMTAGNLTMYTQSLVPKEEMAILFNSTIDTKNGWNRVRLTLGSQKTEFNIIIIGTVVKGNRIALDDVAIQDGSCHSLPSPPLTKNAYHCQVGGKHLTLREVCDFKSDCPDGEEEKQCGYDCNFDNNGQCLWGVRQGDEFYWASENGAANPHNAGPRIDNTLKTKNGRYMYLVSTSYGSEKAVLLSPVLQRAAPNCEFVFSLYDHLSNLKLKIYKKIGGSKYELFTARGDYGMGWRQVVLPFGEIKVPFQILIEASKTWHSSTGSLAIDDIHFRNCGYPVQDLSCTSTNTFQCRNGACTDPLAVCNFADDCGDGTDEDDGVCSAYHMCSFESDLWLWRQEKDDDDFDWTWSVDDRSRAGFKPIIDHTTSTQEGNYIYTKSSSYYDRLPGDKAWLLSPVLKPTSTCVLSMFLLMGGEYIERFSVYTRSAIHGDFTQVFTISGETGGFWFFKSININNPTNFQIVLEGVVGNGSVSNIYIDDVTLSPSCNLSMDSLPAAPPPPITTTSVSSCQDPRQWQCSDKSQCIFRTELCDFISQCSDGSDERDCGTCDFEMSMCGWRDQTRGNFIWKRVSLSTKGKPNTDQIFKGRKVGIFLFAQPTGYGYRRPVVLESPVLGSTEAGCSIRFYFLVGSNSKLFLRLYPKEMMASYESTNAPLDVKLWGSGKKTKWTKATVSIGSRSSGFRLVFVYRNENDLRRHEFAAALDDISFSSHCGMHKMQTCSHREFACTRSQECMPLTARCDLAKDCKNGEDEEDCEKFTTITFEHRSRVFTQSSGEQVLKWKLIQPMTFMDLNVPDRDHTFGNRTGHFMYLMPDTSSKHRDSARLTSRLMYDSQEGLCYMSLFYHLNGDYNDTDGIRVYTATTQGGELNLKWSASKEEGDEWKKAVIPISERSLFQVIIEGVRSEDYRGDIAIDDISFTEHCVGAPYRKYQLAPPIPTPPPGPCTRDGEFACDSQCKPNTKWCDLNVDCQDGSDEASCPSRCDFETGSCEWITKGNVRKDWEVMLVNKTGLLADHNPGTEQGHLLVSPQRYYRGSYYLQLISPFFKGSSTNCAFSLWYREYKHQMDFDIKLRSPFSQNSLLWSQKNATLQSTWQHVTVPIPPCLSSFQVVIESDHYYLDKSLYLDDFAFVGCDSQQTTGVCKPGEFQCSNGHCIQETRLCDVNPDCCDGSDEDPGRCYEYNKNTFENGFGRLKHKTGTKRWVVKNAAHRLNIDHTTWSSLGHYLKRACNNDRGFSRSVVLYEMPVPNGECTVRFWYQFWGVETAGSINVYTKIIDGNLTLETSILSEATQWTRAELKIKLKERYELIFEARCAQERVVSNTYFIDDIIFSPGCNIRSPLPTEVPDTTTQTITSNTAKQTSISTHATTIQNQSTNSRKGKQTSTPTSSQPSPMQKTSSTRPKQTTQPALTTHTQTLKPSPTTHKQTTQPTTTTHKQTTQPTPTKQQQTTQLDPTKSVLMTTTHTTTSLCDLTQTFQCNGHKTCIPITKVCNFNPDCPDKSDEEPCHTQDTCDFDKDMCGWRRTAPGFLEWTRSMSSSVPNNLGPKFDASGQAGSYVYIQDGNVDNTLSTTVASLSSHAFSSSASDCAVEFYYFLNGQDPGAISLEIKLQSASPIVLWHTKMTSDSWTKAIVGIGRQPSSFSLTFTKSSTSSPYSSQVALDKIKFSTSCRERPAQDQCDASKFYRCTRGACVAKSNVCDGQDDCGDGSDETSQLCRGYSREDFESTHPTWGQSHDDNLNWNVWNSSQSIPKGLLGVDHSSYSPNGHYMYVQGTPNTGKTNHSSWLVSEAYMVTSGSLACQIAFYTLLPTDDQMLEVGYLDHETGRAIKLVGFEGLIPGSYWQQMTFTMAHVTKPFHLVIKASPGDPRRAVGIDDITIGPGCRLYNGQVSRQPTASTKSPLDNTKQKAHEKEDDTQEWKTPVGVVGGLFGAITLVAVIALYLRRSGRVGGFRFLRFDNNHPKAANIKLNPVYFDGSEAEVT